MDRKLFYKLLKSKDTYFDFDFSSPVNANIISSDSSFYNISGSIITKKYDNKTDDDKKILHSNLSTPRYIFSNDSKVDRFIINSVSFGTNTDLSGVLNEENVNIEYNSITSNNNFYSIGPISDIELSTENKSPSFCFSSTYEKCSTDDRLVTMIADNSEFIHGKDEKSFGIHYNKNSTNGSFLELKNNDNRLTCSNIKTLSFLHCTDDKIRIEAKRIGNYEISEGVFEYNTLQFAIANKEIEYCESDNFVGFKANNDGSKISIISNEIVEVE